MKIVEKKILVRDEGTRIIKFVINAPLIAKKANPGQFVVLMVKKEGERIPLTIVETFPEDGNISLIMQEVGLTTRLLAKMEPGESLFSIAGPLGHPTEIKKYGRIILVGGGVGIAEIYPVAKGFKGAGNEVTVIIGARTKNLLILEDELRKVSDSLIIMTDDGSYGRKGFVTSALKKLLANSRYELVYAVGPIPMMRAVSELTKPYGVKTVVSLNPIMVDGTGMCGSCRVSIGDEVKFVCIDGPEFDAHLVNWEELASRNKIYLEKEKQISKLYEEKSS
jgi:ferredoxin--NADP+ reductase